MYKRSEPKVRFISSINCMTMRSLLLTALLFLACRAHPSPNGYQYCPEDKCLIENNCRCSTTRTPLGKEAPQLLAITVSESLVKTVYTNYLEKLFFGRTNPDGNPITMTYFVNHEYTDYTLVHDLYVRGNEIGVHSITKNYSQEYWRYASFEDLVEEFDGQRQILTAFANIPREDIVGARTPQLQLEDDVSINAYEASGLLYDNSWPTLSGLFDRYLPYTLDYRSPQECTAMMTCPIESHPGFWIAPITAIKGHNGVTCDSLVACLIEGNSTEISNWLLGQLNDNRKGSRAPLVLRLDSYWFNFTANSFEGFSKFLDAIEELDDVFMVSVKEVVDWVKKPVPLDDFRTATPNRKSNCHSRQCSFRFGDGTRYLTSCADKCPVQYPWKGNPLGN